MKKLVQIVIPIYKKTLNFFEKIALKQVSRILYKYPVTFVAPESLKFSYGKRYDSIYIERFPDEYFKNINSYNRLMLSKNFYQRFLKYESILIYQLDAFVFSDRLQEFCQMGYDYIGAPWLSGLTYEIYNKKYKNFVGNGGFSLRNVESSLRVLQQEQSLCQNWRANEDLFFLIVQIKK